MRAQVLVPMAGRLAAGQIRRATRVPLRLARVACVARPRRGRAVYRCGLVMSAVGASSGCGRCRGAARSRRSRSGASAATDAKLSCGGWRNWSPGLHGEPCPLEPATSRTDRRQTHARSRSRSRCRRRRLNLQLGATAFTARRAVVRYERAPIFTATPVPTSPAPPPRLSPASPRSRLASLSPHHPPASPPS